MQRQFGIFRRRLDRFTRAGAARHIGEKDPKLRLTALNHCHVKLCHL